MSTTIPTPDPTDVQAFAGRAVGDLAATMTSLFCMIGDKLGLFAALRDGGPATPAELAERCAIRERYAAEWLRGMAASGYVTRAGNGRFSLPAGHAALLADEGGATFLGGVCQEVAGMLPTLGRVVESFREGGGVPQSAFHADTYEGMSRFTRAWFDHRLLGEWLPMMPDVRERLEAGARWADVGCGAGLAVIRLAQAFPASTFVGYDAFEPQIQRARDAAAHADVADRVRFEVADAVQGLAETFDVISSFDVVHDAVDPAALLGGIRGALADDGHYVLLEINCADDADANDGPVATLLYGFSVMYCMTTSLAHGGAGLGTCGCPPAVIDALGHDAGFGSVCELPIDDPFNRLYVLRP